MPTKSTRKVASKTTKSTKTRGKGKPRSITLDAGLDEVEEKKKRVAREQKRLQKIFSTLDGNKLQLAMRLIERASFLKVEIEDLEKHLQEHGWIDVYQNGDTQFGFKKSPQNETIINLSKQYTTIISKLMDYVPQEQRRDSKLNAFLNNDEE